jgi:crossover junction endodeoxyribonuclease RuvC
MFPRVHHQPHTHRDIPPPRVQAIDKSHARAEIISVSTLQAKFVWHYWPVGISLQQFKQMKDRVSGKTPAPARVRDMEPTAGLRRAAAGAEIILGVDPSLRGTGYGVIRLAKPCPQTLAHGTVVCPTTWEHSRCLLKISETLRDLIQQHRPTVCVIEGLFFAQNLKTALVMGEARGAALAAIASGGLEIYEIAPRKVKQAIVGYGAAQKIAVAKMVQRMLQLAELPEPDAADALALALTQAQENNRYSLTPPKRV